MGNQNVGNEGHEGNNEQIIWFIGRFNNTLIRQEPVPYIHDTRTLPKR